MREGNRMTNIAATGKLRKVELRQAFAEHFAKKSAWWWPITQYTTSFRGARSASPESILPIAVMDSGPAPSAHPGMTKVTVTVCHDHY
jgi:hypothetical protein